MGSVNIRRVVQPGGRQTRRMSPTPAYGGAVPQIDTGAFGQALANIVAPNRDIDRLVKEVDAVERIRNERALEYDRKRVDITLDQLERGWDLRQRQMKSAKTAAQAEAYAEAYRWLAVRRTAHDQERAILSAMTQKEDRITEDIHRRQEVTAKRAARNSHRQKLLHDAATVAMGKIDQINRAWADGDLSKRYSSYYMSLVPPEVGVIPSKDRQSISVYDLEAAGADTSLDYVLPSRWLGPVGGSQGKQDARLALAIELTPGVERSPKLLAALDAVAGVDTDTPRWGAQRHEAALTALNGEQLALLRGALLTGAARAEMFGTDDVDIESLVRVMDAKDQDSTALLTAWRRMGNVAGPRERAAFRYAGEDLRRMAAELNRPSQVDVDPYLDEFTALIHQAQTDRLNKAEIGQLVRQQLAAHLAEQLTLELALGGGGESIVDEVNTYHVKLRPELIKSLVDQTKAITAAAHRIGHSKGHLDVLTMGDPATLTETMYRRMVLMAPAELRDPKHRDVYMQADDDAARIGQYLSEVERLVESHKAKVVTDKEFKEAVVDPATGRLYDFTVNEDGFPVIQAGPDGPRYFDEQVNSPLAIRMIKGSELFASPPDTVFMDSVSAVMQEIDQQRLHPQDQDVQPAPVTQPTDRQTIRDQVQDAMHDTDATTMQRLLEDATTRQRMQYPGSPASIEPKPDGEDFESRWLDYPAPGPSDYGPNNQIGAGALRYGRDRVGTQLRQLAGAYTSAPPASPMTSGLTDTQQPATPTAERTRTIGGGGPRLSGTPSPSVAPMSQSLLQPDQQRSLPPARI